MRSGNPSPQTRRSWESDPEPAATPREGRSLHYYGAFVIADGGYSMLGG
jgi:hypothetical protein